MIGYRSIGEDELNFLISSDNPVYGRFKYALLEECGCTLPYGVVSFFADNYKWRDSSHLFDIKVELPGDAQVATSYYNASKDFAKTKVFTGRWGKTRHKVKEIFVRSYKPEDIMELNLRNRYTDTYVKNVVVPFCNKYNIKLIH